MGLDPRLDRLPPPVLESARRQHGSDPAWVTRALTTFCSGVLGVVAPYAVAVKINIAFFEQYHLPGVIAYPAVIAEARRQGLLVIGDIKRSDIGSTAEAYAAGHLGSGSGPDPDVNLDESQCFTADAVTINPYLGRDGVAPFIATALKHGGGVYVLVRTSNPSSVEIQQLETQAGSVGDRVARLVSDWGEDAGLTDGYSPVGAVIGATFPEELASLRQRLPHTPFLVPGYGAQGGGAADVQPAFDTAGHGALINASRSIIYAYEQGESRGADLSSWEEHVESAARNTAHALEAVRHAGR